MKKLLLALIFLGIGVDFLNATSLAEARYNARAAMRAERAAGYYIKEAPGRYLRQNHYRTYSRYLYRGNCYVFFGVGDNTVRDLDAILYDRLFNVIASDTSADKNPEIHFCPSRSALYRIRTKMYRGHGYFYQVIGWK